MAELLSGYDEEERKLAEKEERRQQAESAWFAKQDCDYRKGLGADPKAFWIKPPVYIMPAALSPYEPIFRLDPWLRNQIAPHTFHSFGPV